MSGLRKPGVGRYRSSPPTQRDRQDGLVGGVPESFRILKDVESLDRVVVRAEEGPESGA